MADYPVGQGAGGDACSGGDMPPKELGGAAQTQRPHAHPELHPLTGPAVFGFAYELCHGPHRAVHAPGAGLA